MRHETLTSLIPAPAERVARFTADPDNLPRWAIGFCDAIEPCEDAYRVTTKAGETLCFRIDADPARGVVDHRFGPSWDALGTFPTRIVPAGPDACVFVGTILFPDEMPEAAFRQAVDGFRMELAHLRTLFSDGAE